MQFATNQTRVFIGNTTLSAGRYRSASFKQLATHQHECVITSNHGLHTPQSPIEARKTRFLCFLNRTPRSNIVVGNKIPNTRASQVVSGLFHDSALSPTRSGTTQSGCCHCDAAAGVSAHVQWLAESDVVALSALLEPPGHATQHMTMA